MQNAEVKLATVKTEIPEKYNFHNQVFINQLQDFYNQEEYSDILVCCDKGETRRIHSLIVGAASSMMKQAFTDVSVRGMDCELIVLMPDTSVEVKHLQ